MGDCILIYNKDGGVDGVQTVTGNVSKLYPQLLERTKDVEKAVELTAFTRTDTFQEGVIFPILSKYKVAVKRQLETLQPKNSVLQIVHNGKEHAVDIKKLQYKLVEANGFTTLQAYAQAGDESVMLGKVRMKAYKDGLAIESTNLGTTQVYVDGALESLQGKGIGTEMYKYAINHTLRQGKPFYSDANQTASATGVWEKLKATKVVKKEDGRNKIEAFPSTHFDQNQEVLPEILIKYIKAEQTKDKQLSFDQKQDIKNTLLSSPFTNSQEMNEALQKAFYNEKGEFQVEEKKLKGIYNSYEIASIITDKVLQREIKSTLEALKNSEEVIENSIYFLDEFLNKTTTLNSLGKMVNINPLLTEQEVIQELGGVVDEQEFATKVENLELKLEIGDTSEVKEDTSVTKDLVSKYKLLSNKVKQGDLEQYWSFDIPSDSVIEEAGANDRIVDVAGGMGIVTEDGNMIGMFKYDNSVKGTAAAVQSARIAKGGVKLDNFDGYLTKLYEKNGFRVVSRVPFNEEYAPEGWNKKLHGTPDVVAMVYDPSNKLDIKERIFDDYNTAMAYRDSYIVSTVAGNALFNSSLGEASIIASAYMKENGIVEQPAEKILKLDEAQSKRISDAYIAMEITPTDPKTIAAYTALSEETIKQYNFIIKSGYKVEINNNEPYSSAKDMIEDLKMNKRMKIFSTESGFGEEPITEAQRKENMLLLDSGLKDVNGETLLVNDIFRFVHDFFGHAKLGNGFGAIGEENAWNVHIKMYSPLAARAMTTETRGQNSYVNFSGVNEEAFKIRDRARELRKKGKTEAAARLTEQVYEMMKFADQKVGLLPEWVSNGTAPISGGAAFSKFFAKITNTKDGGAKFADVKEVLNKEIDGYENELAAYLKYGMNFQKHIMASIPAFVDARIRVLKGMVEASIILGKNGKVVNMLDITSSEGYFTKAYAQLAQDKGVNAKADALDAGVTFQRDFDAAPQVPGVNYLLQAWGDSFVDPDSGITIPSFKPTKKYGVVFEGMGFQFFTPTRDKEIAEVKDMMEENGMLVTMQKFKNSDYERREILKDEFKAKFFTKEEMAQKAATVLKKSDEVSVGMMDYQFDRQEYEKVLAKNFKYVAQFYSAGNFAGYLATDSLEVMNTALNATGDTTTKFNEEATPKIVKGGEIEYSNNKVQFPINEAVDPKDVIYHGMMVTNPQALEEAFPAVHPNKFYHHSTVAFKPQDTSNIEVGKAQELKVTGRITTDKVDALLVENPKSTNKDAHITLSTAEGVKPFEVNKEIENNREKITAVPADTTVQTTEGYFNGKEDVTAIKSGSKLLTKTKEVAESTEAKVIPAKTASGWLLTGTKDKKRIVKFEGEATLKNSRSSGTTSYISRGYAFNQYSISQSKVKEDFLNSMEEYKKIDSNIEAAVILVARGLISQKLKNKTVIKSLKVVKDDSIEDKASKTKAKESLEKALTAKTVSGIYDALAEVPSNKRSLAEALIIGIFQTKKFDNNPVEIAKIKAQKVKGTITLAEAKLKISQASFRDKTAEERLVEVDAIYENVKEKFKGNLKFVYDLVSEPIRNLSKLWYDGANIIAQDFGRAYNLTVEQSAGIIASQSPQMPWFSNLHLAQAIMEIMSNQKETIFTKEYLDYYIKNAKKYKEQRAYIPTVKDLVGKSLSELSDYDAGIFIRAYYDLNLSRKAPKRLPSGVIVSYEKNESSFSSYTTIEKGVTIFRNGSEESISDELGDANKVRNFYNNIADPTNPNAVTIDTHAMAIANMMPFGASDYEVNFDAASYSMYSDVYNELAVELGLKARELQSITWEAARALFPADEKTGAYKKKIAYIWERYSKGEITIEEVRNEIKENGKDSNITEWHEHLEEWINGETEAEYIRPISPKGGDGASDGRRNGEGINGNVSSVGSGNSGRGGSILRGRRGVVEGNEETALIQRDPLVKIESKAVSKSLFQKMQDFKRMPEMKIVGEVLQQVENNDIKIQLEQTFSLSEDESISSDIIYLNELPQDLYDENIQDVQELIQEIEKKAAKQGIDIVGLGEKISSKTRDDIYDLLESLNTLTTTPSQEAFEDFITQHELIFGTEKTPSIKVQKVLPSNKSKSLISLDTKVSEYVLFDKLGLVKVSEGVYQRVQKEELPDLYNKLYEIAQYNEGILPIEAFPFLNKGGTLNLSTLRDAENRDIITEDIKAFIENKVTTLDLSSASTDNKVLQQLLINKYAFNHPIVINSEVNVQQEFESFNNFDGSELYLTTDFISDFYQEYLAEKIKSSKLFKDFYSNFAVNEKGIVLVKDDAITVGVIKDYLKERKVKKAKDLANYSLLSNQLPNLKEVTEQSSDYSREFFRSLYTNNPMSLEKLRQDYSALGADTILIKNSTENFVRVKGGVFELIATKNNVGFYEKIGENKGDYKTFKSEEPVLSVDSSKYGAEGVSIEDFIKTEKYYTKKQEGEINDEYLGCL